MKLGEEHFHYIKEARDGRWHPYNILRAFLGMFMFGVFINSITLIGLFQELQENENSLMYLFIGTLIITLLIQFILIVILYNPELVLKLQKFQAFILPFFMFKLALDPLMFYWFICIDNNLSFWFYILGSLVLIISISLAIFRTFEIIIKLNSGDLKKDGKGLYKFKSVIFSGGGSFIFGFTAFAIALPQITAGTGSEGVAFAFTMLVASLGLSIPMLYTIPEALLLFYYLVRYNIKEN